MGSLDWTVFHWLNGQAGQHEWLDQIGKMAATQLALVLVVTLGAGWLLAAAPHLWRERRLPRPLLTVVLTAGGALALGLAVNWMIGYVWFRPRPYAHHPSANLIVSPSADHSFPSDHATAGFALSLGSAAQLPRTAALLFVETLFLGAARVYVGLHYPGDVLGSLVVAASAALVVSWLVSRAGTLINRAVAFANRFADRNGWPVRLS